MIIMEYNHLTSDESRLDFEMTEEERGMIRIYAEPTKNATLETLRLAKANTESEYRSLIALFAHTIEHLAPLSEDAFRSLTDASPRKSDQMSLFGEDDDAAI